MNSDGCRPWDINKDLRGMTGECFHPSSSLEESSDSWVGARGGGERYVMPSECTRGPFHGELLTCALASDGVRTGTLVTFRSNLEHKVSLSLVQAILGVTYPCHVRLFSFLSSRRTISISELASSAEDLRFRRELEWLFPEEARPGGSSNPLGDTLVLMRRI